MRVAIRAGAVVLSLIAVGALGTAGFRALQGRHFTGWRSGSLDTRSPGVAPVRSSQLSPAAVPAVLVARAGAELSEAVTQPSSVAPRAAIMVTEGRTELGNGLFAVRRGTSVRVNFDVAEARTRRRDKFDRIVRTTLPIVYGPAMTEVMDRIPVGALVQPGYLPAQLTETGIRLPLRDGRRLILWPETRDARDGPLVVAYRAELSR